MAVSVAAQVATYEAMLATKQSQLAALSQFNSVSDQGRSMSQDRKALMDEIDWIQRQLAALGSPVGTIGVPFVQTSRMKP